MSCEVMCNLLVVLVLIRIFMIRIIIAKIIIIMIVVVDGRSTHLHLD